MMKSSMKKNYLYLAGFFLFLFININEVSSQVPHIVYGTVEYSNGNNPSSIQIEAYIVSRSDEKISGPSSDCSYYPDTGQWTVQCASFPTKWNNGDVFHIDFDDAAYAVGSIEVTLTDNPYDNAGNCIISIPKYAINIVTNPSNLKVIVDNVEYDTPGLFNWEQGSSHIIDVVSPQIIDDDKKYTFIDWSDNGSKSHSFTVPGADQTLTANFKIYYYLTVNSSHGNPFGEGWYEKMNEAGFSVDSLDNQGDTRYIFNEWHGDYSGTDTSHSIIMNSPKIVSAQWKTQHYLSVNSKYGEPSGSDWYYKDVNAYFSVNSYEIAGQTRYKFENWTGDYSGQSTGGFIRMDTSKIINTVWQTQYSLLVQENPDFGGSVTITPTGVWQDSSSQVQIQAVSAYDYRFIEWTGDISGTENIKIFFINNPHNITANFLKEIDIKIDTNPSGFSVSVDGVEYDTPHIFTWLQGRVHTITAISPQYIGKDTRYSFKSWNNGADQTQSYTVPDQDEILFCSFTKQFHLTVDSDHGYPDGTGWYDVNSTAQFSVISPDLQETTKYIFSKWSGDYNKTTPSGSVIMDRPKVVFADWKTQYFLTVNNSGHGSVTGEGWYDEGAAASFSITSTVVSEDEGIRYNFEGWEGEGSGSYSGTLQSHSLTMNNPIIENVKWKKQYFLSTSENPDQGGDITPAPPGRWYNSDENADILATPASSYQFYKWSGDLTGNTNPVSLSMTEPFTVSADFSRIIQVTINTSPSGLTFIADGSENTAPHTFSWLENSNHTISVNPYQEGSSNIRYRYISWSDEGDTTHVFTVPSTNTAVIAEFQLQYFLCVDSEFGDPQGEGWHDSNKNANFSVSSQDIQGFTKKIFNRWTGDFSGSSVTGSVFMNRPKSVTANWHTEYFLELNSEHGTTSGHGWHANGAAVTFSVSPEVETLGDTIRFIFTRWRGTGDNSYTGNNNSHTVIMNNPIIERAEWNTNYFLSTSENPEIGGDINPPPPGKWYDRDAEVSISASSSDGYHFSGWSGDLNGDVNPQSILMNSPKQVEAGFGTQFEILVRTNPAGLKFSADETEYTAPHIFIWTAGSIHRLSVETPQKSDSTSHYEFLSWSNNKPKVHNYTVPDNNDTLTVMFKSYYYLAVNSPYGKTYGEKWCIAGTTAEFSVDSLVELGRSRQRFYQWSGDYTGTEPSASLKMNSAKTVTAVWNKQHFVEVISEWGETSGQGWYNENLEVEIGVTSIDSINSTMRYSFLNWEGTGEYSYSGENITPVITVKNPIIETAKWILEYHVSTSVTPQWGGSIDLSPPGEWHRKDSLVYLTALPNTSNNYIFSFWQGDISGKSNPDTLMVNSPKNVRAIFITTEETLITSEPSGLPVVVDGKEYISPKYFNWEYGTLHTMSVPAEYQPDSETRYLFRRWSDYGSIEHDISAGDKQIFTAYFDVQYFLFTEINPSNGGIVSPASPGNWFNQGQTAAVSVNPSPGYVFKRWTGDTSGTENPVLLYLNRSKCIIANLEQSSSLNDGKNNYPERFALMQNYPNPFNPQTLIRYQVPEAADVTLVIYNIKGQKIKTLINSRIAQGSFEVVWDGTNEYNKIVGNGIYYYILTSEDVRIIKKLIFLK